MILLAYGTRPEYIKIKPLIDEFNKRNLQYKTLFTGQHTDLLKKSKPDYSVTIHDFENGNRLDSIIASILQSWDSVHGMWDNITHVLVQGDTTSVLGVALSAFHRDIKVIHLEAGLRTYDNANPYPEEQNRRLVSQITNIHLCPTPLNKIYLEEEKILGDKYVVGNTVIDNLVEYKEKCEYTNKVLVTMHRRENHHWIDKWFTAINSLAKQLPDCEFILPLHPNPKVQEHKEILTHVNVIEPVSHDELLNILVKTKLVITDSGGIQEECSFFNKKCLTCRKVTERPEAIGQSTIMVQKPEDLVPTFVDNMLDYRIDYDCPFGDGNSAKKITEILMNLKK